MHGMIGSAATRVHRVQRRRTDWTLKEHEVIISYWPDVTAIRDRLPHRSKRAVHAFAGRCNLTTPRHAWTTTEDAKLRKLAAEGLSRREIAEALGKTLNQIAGRLAYTRTTIARKPPRPSSNSLVTAIRQRAFDLNLTMSDLDRSLGNRSIFRQAAGRQKIAHIHILKAVKALGGELTVRWSDE